MTTDSLARRLRFSPPSPTNVDAIYPQDADRDQWAAISHHGPLPITYLQGFAGRKNYANLQRRCTRFYHQGYLSRPPRQYANFHARYSPLVYDLTPKSKVELTDACSHPPSRSAPFVHQLMQACFTASVALLAPTAGLRFVCRHEIFGHPRCLQKGLPLQLAQGRLIPDDLFALERDDGKRRFFLLEIDRATESIERSTGSYNTWAKKVASYDEMFRRGLHQAAWSFPKATVLTVTTNAGHAENLHAFVGSRSAFADRFTFLVEPTFGPNWRVPKELLDCAKGIL